MSQDTTGVPALSPWIFPCQTKTVSSAQNRTTESCLRGLGARLDQSSQGIVDKWEIQFQWGKWKIDLSLQRVCTLQLGEVPLSKGEERIRETIPNVVIGICKVCYQGHSFSNWWNLNQVYKWCKSIPSTLSLLVPETRLHRRQETPTELLMSENVSCLQFSRKWLFFLKCKW